MRFLMEPLEVGSKERGSSMEKRGEVGKDCAEDRVGAS